MFSKLMHQLSLVRRKIIEEGARRDDEEIQKLTSNYRAIRAVLEDEENKQWKKDNVAVDLLNDIDDSLDELMLKSTIRKVHTSIPFNMFSCRRLVLCRDIAMKLKILNQKLDAVAVKRDGFDREIELVRDKTSVIDSSLEVLGRDEETNKVVKLLLSESSQAPTLPTISIVGMAGIGKTTLARHVFNNDSVKTHFDKRIWVCASYPLDEIRVAKTILESLKDGTSNLVDIETVLQQISQCIGGQKFLLVLDDVWCEYSGYWERLNYSLKSSSQGSRILVTTREENIADKMGTTEKISLGRLSEEGSWSLFYQVALRNNDECQKLEHIGRKIVGKCNGLPLGVRIIGSLLQLKKSLEEWQNVLDCEIWKLEQEEKVYFLPLLLSYHNLPSILKKCFSYCAIFPKNYEIEKDRLIKLWMSQGFLQVEGREDMELIGEEVFRNLATRSFFQDFQKDKHDDRIIRCKMHGTVHDFAQFLTKNECFTLEFNGSKKGQFESSYENLQHLMIMFEREGSFPLSVYHRKKLRSLLVEPGGGFMTGIVLSGLFDKLTCLRALDLSNQDNTCYKVIKEVPRGIKKLIHLRYLNLSQNSKIKKLPETLCELYNLESLELSWCINLKKLPQRIGKLINMRHVGNDGTSLSYMPRGIERLTCLRTLSEFIVGGGSDDEKSCTLECLKNLNHLQGSLRIKKLGNVNKDEINNAELMKKENLLQLYLSFEKDEEKGRKNEEDENAFEDLQPPPNLERLEIHYYRGSRISLMRVISLTNLRLISLDHCMNLEQLPRLGELPSLESLTIRNMRSLEKVGNESLGTDQSSSTGRSFVAFPKLESLEFQKMNGWKEWKYTVTRRAGEDIKIMPCLHSLKIGFCPKLETLPDDYLPETLMELKIISCPKLEEHYKEGTAERQKISHIKVSFD